MVAARIDAAKAKRILRVLGTYMRPLSASEISEKTNISRPVVARYLLFLNKKGLARKKKVGARVKWV